MEDRDSFYKEFGERVKIARKTKKWNQSRLATKSGLSQSYISEIESGKARITIDALVDLCQAFELSPNTLLGKTEPYISPDLAIAIQRMDAVAQRKLCETYYLLFK